MEAYGGAEVKLVALVTAALVLGERLSSPQG
jgi:hypothetical protein